MTSRGICPECGYIFDDETNLADNKAKPKQGDIGICINCGSINEYDDLGVVLCKRKIKDFPKDQVIEILRISNQIRARGKIR